MRDRADAGLAARLEALGANAGGGDWGDVLERARDLERKRAPRRRGWAVALAVSIIGLALVAGPALGLHEPVLRFFESEPAPEPVQKAFESLDAQAPTPEWRPGVVRGQTRIVMRAYFADKWHTLSVVPTRYGGLCTEWSGAGGGCDRLGTVPLSITWGASRPFRLPEGGRLDADAVPIDYFTGFAHSKWIHEIEIRYEDGDVDRPRVVWVSDPINAGFFAYDIPKEHLRPGHRLSSVVGLDEDGDVVTSQSRLGGDRLRVPPPDALVDEKEKAVEIETGRGPAVIWTAPTRYEGSCAWLELDGRQEPFRPCVPKGYEHDGISARFVYRRDALLFLGSVGLGVASAEFRFADGETVTVRPRDGFLLYDVPPVHLKEGRHLTEVVLRRGDGSEVTRIDAARMAADRSCLAPLSSDGDPLACERSATRGQPR